MMTTATVALRVPAKPYREVTPDGIMRINMHWGQSRVWQSKAREVVFLGGTQVGKTCFVPDWLYREIKTRGQGDYIVLAASYPLLDLKLLPEFLRLFHDLLHLGVYRAQAKVFEFTDGKTRVIFRTADNAENIESATALAGVCDEVGQRQFRRESREALLRRLTLNKGRVLYTTTPYGLGWFKNEIVDRAGPENDIEVITCPSTANPAFPREEFEKARRTMPPWKFRMFYEGRFERPAGLVYDAFDDAVCKIRRFPLPTSWPRFVGHDFGTANPAALFFAQDPATGYFYGYDEYLPGPGRSTNEHVIEFKRRTAGMNVLKRVGGNQTTEEEIREAYRAHGWPIQASKLGSVQAQIDRVYALHKLNKVFVFDDVGSYLDELASFSYVLDEKYEPTDRFEDEPSYHLLACARYLLSDFTPETAARPGATTVYRLKPGSR